MISYRNIFHKYCGSSAKLLRDYKKTKKIWKKKIAKSNFESSFFFNARSTIYSKKKIEKTNTIECDAESGNEG